MSLYEHVQEGIEYNQKRKAEYFLLSQGRSDRMFNTLIGYERMSLTYIKWTGFERKILQKAKAQGLRYLDEEFQMTPNPGIAMWLEPLKPQEKMNPISPWRLMREIQACLSNQDIEKIYASSLREIRRLEEVPRFNCLSRHLLESMARVAWLALQERSKQELAGLLLKHMVWGLFGAKHVDMLAVGLQREGLSILYHDLPIIQFE